MNEACFDFDTVIAIVSVLGVLVGFFLGVVYRGNRVR